MSVAEFISLYFLEKILGVNILLQIYEEIFLKLKILSLVELLMLIFSQYLSVGEGELIDLYFESCFEIRVLTIQVVEEIFQNDVINQLFFFR